LLAELYDLSSLLFAETPAWKGWEAAFLIRHSCRSQFDVFVDLCRKEFIIPDKSLALTETGPCRGQRGRLWSAVPGNIHITAYLSPDREEIPGIGFSMVSAVSVVEAIDSVPGLRNKAGIKWVNDILIEEAKVAGFLAHIQSSGRLTEKAVLGIGLNVETRPPVKPDQFVPRAAALSEFIGPDVPCESRMVLSELLKNLLRNYRLLLHGKIGSLLEVYRKRSVIIGRHVSIVPDIDGYSKPSVEGRVESIGANLELIISGTEKPVTSGRLILHQSNLTYS